MGFFAAKPGPVQEEKGFFPRLSASPGDGMGFLEATAASPEDRMGFFYPRRGPSGAETARIIDLAAHGKTRAALRADLFRAGSAKALAMPARPVESGAMVVLELGLATTRSHALKRNHLIWIGPLVP